MEASLLKPPEFTVYRGREDLILQHINGTTIALQETHGQLNIKEIDSAEMKKKVAQDYSKKEYYGIYGIIEMDGGKYLTMVLDCQIIGYVLKNSVFRIHSLEYIPLRMSNDKKINKKYQDMINNVVNYRSMYFSTSLNLTCNIQTVLTQDDQTYMSEKSDERFFYNIQLMQPFLERKLFTFVTPIIQGYFTIQHCEHKNHDFDFILISRKDYRRLGKRFLVRGLDKDGHAANFVETEQVIIYNDEQSIRVASYIQIRGSIPLLWSQKIELKYTPKITLNKDEKLVKEAARKHFAEQIDKYKRIQCVSLINTKPPEKIMGDTYTRLYEILKKDHALSYIWFDFHKECKKMKWHNLSKLMDQIRSEIDQYNYFLSFIDSTTFSAASSEKSAVKIQLIQDGVVRTNCMDSLDRTNVVQSVIARNILHQQLNKIGITKTILKDDNPFEPFPEEVETIFRNCWTNNADELSRLYSGTPALKTDFTRTGKRSKKGAINDGRNSVKRYFLNNLCDGYHQNCCDLSTGHINPRKYIVNTRTSVRRFGVACVGAVALPLLAYKYCPVLLPETQSPTLNTAISWGIPGLLVILGLATIFKFGEFFVSKPTKK